MGELTSELLDINFRVESPDNLPIERWRQIQQLSRTAFAGVLDMDPEDLNDMVRWDYPESFGAARSDPTIDVRRGRVRPPADNFSNPLVVTAQREDGEVVGYISSVNASSSSLRIARDLALVKRNYHWIREIAVAPHYRRRGLGTVMSCLLLERRSGLQPTAVNVWLEARKLINKLIAPEIGFEPKGFFPETPQPGMDLHSQRLGINTGLLLKNLVQRPGVKKALDFAEVQQSRD